MGDEILNGVFYTPESFRTRCTYAAATLPQDLHHKTDTRGAFVAFHVQAGYNFTGLSRKILHPYFDPAA